MREFLTVAFLRALGAVSQLFITFVVALNNSPDIAGSILTIYSILWLLALAGTYGFDIFSLRALSKTESLDIELMVRSLLVPFFVNVYISSGFLIFFGILLFTFNSHIAPYTTIVASISIQFPIMSMGLVLGHQLQALGYKKTAIFLINICVPCTTGFLLYIFTIDSVTGFLLAGFASSILIASIAIKILLSFCKSEEYRICFKQYLDGRALWVSFRQSLFRDTRVYWLISFLLLSSVWSSQLLAALFISPKELAAVNISHRIASLISFGLVVINFTTAPKYSRAYSAGNIEKFQNISVTAQRTILPIGILLFGFLVYNSHDFLSRINESYSEYNYVLIILCTAQLFNVASGSVSYMLNMAGKQVGLLKILMLSTAVQLFLTAWLSYQFGPTGTVIAFGGFIVLQNILAARLVIVQLSINPFSVFKC